MDLEFTINTRMYSLKGTDDRIKKGNGQSSKTIATSES